MGTDKQCIMNLNCKWVWYIDIHYNLCSFLCQSMKLDCNMCSKNTHNAGHPVLSASFRPFIKILQSGDRTGISIKHRTPHEYDETDDFACRWQMCCVMLHLYILVPSDYNAMMKFLFLSLNFY